MSSTVLFECAIESEWLLSGVQCLLKFNIFTVKPGTLMKCQCWKYLAVTDEQNCFTEK